MYKLCKIASRKILQTMKFYVLAYIINYVVAAMYVCMCAGAIKYVCINLCWLRNKETMFMF